MRPGAPGSPHIQKTGELRANGINTPRSGSSEVLLAAAIQGAIFAVEAAVDRGTAEATRKVTGTWPGESE
ncbi:MAG: DUF4235 domain-containing protein [Actinobacteria bacterium]|nr:DUF4235 domain-containing protein [Actinomycetota bacterium]